MHLQPWVRLTILRVENSAEAIFASRPLQLPATVQRILVLLRVFMGWNIEVLGQVDHRLGVATRIEKFGTIAGHRGTAKEKSTANDGRRPKRFRKSLHVNECE